MVGGNRRVEIDTACDTRLLHQVDEVLGRDIAGGLGGERATPKPAERGIEDADACLISRPGIGDAGAAGVVEMAAHGDAIAQQLRGDAAEAYGSVSQASELIEKQSLVVMPVFLAPYLATELSLYIGELEQASRSEFSSDVVEYKKQAYESGKAAVGNSNKYAPYRTKILRMMGLYYWLINSQKRAVKWWGKSIQEGERLGARPDLSRTYFEVGKRLLEPQSKYKELKGIDARGYLEKARIMFEEMGLERDLDELERINS